MADGKWFLECGPETPIEDVRKKLQAIIAREEFRKIRRENPTINGRKAKVGMFDAIAMGILNIGGTSYSDIVVSTGNGHGANNRMKDFISGRIEIDNNPFFKLFKPDSKKLKQLYFDINECDIECFSGETDEDKKKHKIDILNLLCNGNPPSQEDLDSLKTEGSKMTLEQQIKDLIQIGGCRQIIFTGAPGTGKTYIAKQIAGELSKNIPDEQKLNNNGYEFVQFHPSYDYTDFVEGIRPVDISGDIQFVKLDGIFKKFCRKVVELNKKRVQSDEQSKDNTQGKTNEEIPLYFFIIDEINRADLSKVFGELMFGLEKDKRGSDNAFATQYSNLPTYDIGNGYLNKQNDAFADGFYIPENVVIIGTMNDIDRSVESMDFALRRRFEWKEFVVDEEMLISAFKSMFGEQNVDINNLVGSIIALNNYIEDKGKNYGLNRQYDISQGQFANIPSSVYENEEDKVKAIKEHVWDYRIESLLREYLRGEDEGSIIDFLTDAANAYMINNSNSQAAEQPEPDTDNEPKDAESEDQN